jgi:lysophospholipase L1-like esterase
MVIRPEDPRLTWQGHVSLQRAEDWVMPWRIPFEERGLFPPQALQDRAAMPAGVRIAFRSDTRGVGGSVVANATAAELELLCDGRLHGTVSLAGEERFQFEGLPAGEKLLELWLPQTAEFRLRGLAVDVGATVAPFVDPRPRWITYGSSITHCGSAKRPTATWPSLVARERGLNLTCLGYGGNCHLDPMIARMMRGLPADYLSMCVGINIYGSGSLNARTFQGALIGFIRILREGHPETPLAVMSPIFSPPRETKPNAVGFTLEAMRAEVAAAVAALQAHGDRNVRYVDGLRVFGPEHAHLLPDQLHPNPEGYAVMARGVLREVVAGWAA